MKLPYWRNLLYKATNPDNPNQEEDKLQAESRAGLWTSCAVAERRRLLGKGETDSTYWLSRTEKTLGEQFGLAVAYGDWDVAKQILAKIERLRA